MTSETTAKLFRLKRRAQFLAVARGKRWTSAGFVLQAKTRGDDVAEAAAGLGFTASRKVGNAVKRNRARRRLKEAAKAVFPNLARSGVDYVIVARQAALTCPFEQLTEDLKAALTRLRPGV